MTHKGFENNLILGDALTAVGNEKTPATCMWETQPPAYSIPSAPVPVASDIILLDSRTLHRVSYIDSETFIDHHQDQQAFRTPFVPYEHVTNDDNNIMSMWNESALTVNPDLHRHSMFSS